MPEAGAQNRHYSLIQAAPQIKRASRHVSYIDIFQQRSFACALRRDCQGRGGSSRGRWQSRPRTSTKDGPVACARTHRSFARQRRAIFRDRALGSLQNVRAMGEDPGSRRGRWHRQCRGRSVHDYRQRRNRKGWRLLSTNNQESNSRPAYRL